MIDSFRLTDYGKPFDVAQGKPFDGAQGKPFDVAQGKLRATYSAPCSTPPIATTMNCLPSNM